MREHFLRRLCSLHMNQLIGELSINFSNHSIQYIYLHFRIQSDSSLEHAFCVKLQTRKKTRWFTYNPLRREMCKLLTVQMHAYSLRLLLLFCGFCVLGIYGDYDDVSVWQTVDPVVKHTHSMLDQEIQCISFMTCVMCVIGILTQLCCQEWCERERWKDSSGNWLNF